MFDRRTFIKAASTGAALGALVGRGAASHDDQFDSVREAAVDPYLTDPRQAVADGYEIGGPYEPTMGWHFLNQDNVNQATITPIDITEPQVLVYVDERFVPNSLNRLEFDEDTGLRLGAVEYAIPEGVRGHTEDNPPDLFDDDHAELETTEAEGWHVHPKAEHAFLTEDGQATDPGEDCQAFFQERLDTTNWLEVVPGGAPGHSQLRDGDEVRGHFAGGNPMESRVVVSSEVHPDLLTLHVWLGIDNPHGVFAPDNPAVSTVDDHDHDH